jgi:hypothetical protein
MIVGVAELPPKLTDVALDRLTPVIVIVSPPAVEPAVGDTETATGPGT